MRNFASPKKEVAFLKLETNQLSQVVPYEPNHACLAVWTLFFDVINKSTGEVLHPTSFAKEILNWEDPDADRITQKDIDAFVKLWELAQNGNVVTTLVVGKDFKKENTAKPVHEILYVVAEINNLDTLKVFSFDKKALKDALEAKIQMQVEAGFDIDGAIWLLSKRGSGTDTKYNFETKPNPQGIAVNKEKFDLEKVIFELRKKLVGDYPRFSNAVI
jgi:hypothetical protein